MPLKVIVVGAGLGGLAAAIAFTQAGHDVEVFERSSFHNEVGAAIHLAPNATRLLKKWDVGLKEMDPVRCDHLSVWDKSGQFIATPAVTKDLQGKLGIDDDWLLVHRVDLHSALHAKARETYRGKKPEIHLACAVNSVDSTNGLVLLTDGRELKADIIIGADGVHSRTVNGVIDMPQKKKSTGQNCFRFLVPTEKAEKNPLTKSLIDTIGLKSLNTFFSGNERLIVYPCRSEKLINCVLFQPTGGNEAVGESSWLNAGNHDDLLAAAETYGPEIRELCSLGEDVKLWSLASRDPPPTFSKGRLALIGDAAHPMLPHQGQGGAQAFEDAATLGALFPADTKPEQVSERLQFYSEIRYKHTVTIMVNSRVGNHIRHTVLDDLRQYVPDAEIPENMWLYAWDSYPDKVAERAIS
ncbi:hypothetical protein FOVG_19359 [Fusarium oxysporum f. sp. pisi HDV247]|uniref:FAD-binding domain-containing protein n=1 Tax=Fusarium oxysporum f. sp. pisi HDV247 TaxID=1080344 RepID=W9N8Z0_FUSOX|nr:hypothetical protein FOVG_19359 [Fusarium oxysporum f. sp. pisi HDV247]